VCIVNGENVADGAGITAKLADKLLLSGADVITLGNTPTAEGSATTRAQRDRDPPATPAPGRPAWARRRRGAQRRQGAVVNLLGSLYLDTPQSPWEVVDVLVDEAREHAPSSCSTSTRKRRARRSRWRAGSTGVSPP